MVTPVFNVSTPSHNVFHQIPTLGRLVWVRPCCLVPNKLKVAQDEFSNLEKLCIICPSTANGCPRCIWHLRQTASAHCIWHLRRRASPWQPCGDYCRLNLASVQDRYTIPHILDFMAGLARCSVFSKIDLMQGYHQVPVHPDDIPMIAVTTPFGL